VINAISGSVVVNASTDTSVGLTVNQSNNGVAIAASSSAAGSGYATVQATIASSSAVVSAILGYSTGAAPALAGQIDASGTASEAVFGSNLRTAGGYGVYGSGVQGVVGENDVTDAAAIFGLNDAAASGNSTDYAPGVVGQGYWGTVGQTTIDGGVGVVGLNGSTQTDNDNEGVFGQGESVGVEGTSALTAGYGLVSGTNALIVGVIQVQGSKMFHIDNPLDPANKYLNHFSAESNEVLNLYRGNVILDASGAAMVTLPAYFSAINTDYSYILTAVGGAAPNLHISKEIAGNVFSIAGGTAGLKVSWQVTATRNDPYLRAHPEMRVVEQEKSASEKGKYLAPELYGASSDKAIFHLKADKQAIKLIGETQNTQLHLNVKGSVSGQK
jgi:hypothetical protein